MTLTELGADEVRRRLNQEGLILKIGPFSFRLFSPIPSVLDGVLLLYGDYPVGSGDGFVDFTVSLLPGNGVRRWVNRQAIFYFDGQAPFKPLPLDCAFPMLEWAMNWCIATQAHHYLILHSAVIEREGCAVIMPAPPGSGKSTLCAGLIHRGWRLLSDEMALVSLADASITPLGRPVSLKNQSLEVIRHFAPEVVYSRVTHNTAKGSVIHMRVPTPHLQRLHESAKPRWVIFPKYVAGAAAQLSARSKGDSMLELGRNAFNYIVLGLTGFEALSRVITASDCYDFQYSQLEEAVAVFDDLVARRQA